MTADERVVVIGAGPSGLAVARQLKHGHNIDALVVDRADAPASAWRNRYDGFRLNTCGFWSHLPGQRIPRRYGRWPTGDDMVNYFDDYVRRQALRLRLGVGVERLDRVERGWCVHSDTGALTAAAVLVATGNYHSPEIPAWPGKDTFSGEILHSADYRNARRFVGRDVLVVGSGNSATDIALQLSDAGARRVRMAVRRPPHLVPRSAAGVPIDAFSPVLRRLPMGVLDTAAKIVQRLWFGDLTAVGLPAPRSGIYTDLVEEERIPTLGDELVAHVKGGRIQVVDSLQSFDGAGAVLADGTTIHPDVVIAATGYRRGLEPLVGHLDVLDTQGKPMTNGPTCATTGLWFAGYDEPLIGPLRSMRLQAPAIAESIAAHLDIAG